ncbi:hypothetical protein Q7C36_010732 [Tachysurus vachellii]|uniref:Uncharacterized protein n=1 Tax=Tachysurus vachellii TaxID=175792 RepID=A0AA88MZI7_TACVA|nr:hypothetical protein Q7C36_010732 [Tachysurus vachellii]
MMQNLKEYLNKRLGIRKCYYDVCQKYSLKQSESGTWDLADIKMAYGKTQHFRANLRRDGLSVIVGRQIRQHLHKCETDKLQQNYYRNQCRKSKGVEEATRCIQTNTKFWQILQRLQKIYTLHPLDGAMILNVNLRDIDQN